MRAIMLYKIVQFNLKRKRDMISDEIYRYKIYLSAETWDV